MGKFVGVNGSGRHHELPPVDWQALKDEIIAGLDVAAEYESFGIVFTKGFPRDDGRRECRAFGREDRHPSAFVNVRTGVYHDSGGDGESCNLFDFALRHGDHGRTWFDVLKYYANKAGVRINGEFEPDRKGRIVEAEYVYEDESGSPRYKVVRYRCSNGSKTFGMASRDDAGEWTWSMAGVGPLPYLLPALIKADPSEAVWIVEGEKDADRLVSLGLIATTSHGGVGSTNAIWPKIVHYFRDRLCHVVTDNDDGGRGHAIKVSRFLSGVSLEVKLIELPGLSDKGDVSDWLDLGHDVNELDAVAFAAPTFDPKTRRLTVRGSDVVPKKTEWLWPGRIPYRFITIFAGRTGLGKSFVTCDVTARVTVGGEWPFSDGARSTPGNVLFIGEDSVDYVLAPRLIEMGCDMDRVSFWNWDQAESYVLSDVDMLAEACYEAGNPVLVVIDPPTNFLGDNIDEHKNSQVRGVLMRLVSWLHTRDWMCAIVMITHVNKGSSKDLDAINRVIGSVAWVSTARIAHTFAPSPDDDHPDRVLFSCPKSNVSKTAKTLAFRVTETMALARVEWIGEVDISADDAMQGKQVKQSSRREAAEWLVEMFNECQVWSNEMFWERAKKAGVSKNDIDHARPLLGGYPRGKKGPGGGYVRYVPDDWAHLKKNAAHLRICAPDPEVQPE